ncbi:MAG: FliM/FliN family flagellar motor switch protein [Bryobacterales bacterium]|nr:FliM/FliN family flagellar motor switch protein [Bryobacterales bacterium]
MATTQSAEVSRLQSMEHHADLPMEIEVELDQRPMTVRDLLNLAAGSIVRLTRSAGENVDVCVNGSRVAVGEIVILQNKVGVRITDFESE